MRGKHSRLGVLIYALGALPVVWIALLLAPSLSEGLPGLLKNLGSVFDHPFAIHWGENSLKTVLALLCVYCLCLMVYLSNSRNYRRGEEYGSAKWGSPEKLRKYAEKEYTRNIILTQNVRIGLNGRKHKRNLNVVIVGGSGAGKSFKVVVPNLSNANTSFVILDPKGELLRATGNLLLSKGYVIKVLDLISMEKSHCYNPFVYLRNDNDIQLLVTNLFRNTTPKGSQPQDPFWDNTAMMLLKALILYLHYEAPPDEQNFSMVLVMLRYAEVKEENENYSSPLDILFERLKRYNPEHPASVCYELFKKGAGKTSKSIIITLISHLEKFTLSSLASITQYDELDLARMGEEKTALFAIIPDNDTSFNFLVGMLYTQLFEILEEVADNSPGGRLPVHVHFLMDEFPNVAIPESFERNLATMRSREMSVSIFLQNISQLKALFEKQWESIMGNCDEFVYLGGNEQSTHEYVSKLLGKETIDTNTYGRSKGRNGSYSTNWQLAGRELMTPDEVRMLDNRYALVFIRGERPVKDEKYDVMKHPNVNLTTYGGAPPYLHGRDTRSVGSFSLDDTNLEAAQEITWNGESSFELLSEEELYEEIEQEEKQHEKK